jgi:transcriptional regulator with XRE-family HTH domain
MTEPERGGAAVARRRLGKALRALREERDITGCQAGAVIGCSGSKISRIELGQLSLKLADVEALLDFYGVGDDQERDRLVRLVPIANARPGWHRRYNDVMPEWLRRYIRLESAALHIRTFETMLVPGLLQTPEYARAVMRAGPTASDPYVINRRVELRMRRQQVFAESRALLWAVIDESALRREVGDRGVMRAQLQHLLAQRERHDVTIQVLPFQSGGKAVDTAGFVLLRLATQDPDLPDVIYMEHLTGALILDGHKEVTPYNEAFVRLAGMSRPADASAGMIANILSET